jgi:hypothetical protein
MKTVFASLAAVAALSAVAAPARAQPGYGYARSTPYVQDRYDGRYDGRDRYDNRGWYDINQRQARLDRRIDQGVRRGDLTWREAAGLRAEFRDIARLEYRYRANGLSGWERADLDRRFDRLEQRIRYERHDREDRRW